MGRECGVRARDVRTANQLNRRNELTSDTREIKDDGFMDDFVVGAVAGTRPALGDRARVCAGTRARRCVYTRPLAACGSPVTYTGLANGLHFLQVRARDSAGNVDPTPATRTWLVNAADTIKPRLTRLKLSRSLFAAAAHGSTLAKATAKSGIKVSYTLTEPASVTFTIQRRKGGRMVNGKCRALTRTNKRRKKCDLPLKGSAKRQGNAGKNSLRFRGRLSGRKLRPDRYDLVATATDAAGNRADRKRIKFTIVKR